MTADRIQPETRSANAEQSRALPLDVQRMMGLERSADLLGGKPALADALAISPRALRHKLTGDRGISNSDALFAAQALEHHAAQCSELAAKLRTLTTTENDRG
jgi:DNA-binding transcriptional regulator YdaS (Cro superfamily)